MSNYTLCVKLHTAKLHRSTWGPFVGTFRVNCQKIPLTWKNFPQTLFAAFVTNIRYVFILFHSFSSLFILFLPIHYFVSPLHSILILFCRTTWAITIMIPFYWCESLSSFRLMLPSILLTDSLYIDVTLYHPSDWCDLLSFWHANVWAEVCKLDNWSHSGECKNPSLSKKTLQQKMWKRLMADVDG